MLQFQHILQSKNGNLRIFWLVIGLFAGIFLLEAVTAPDYVFGYLYVGPILLASAHLGRKFTYRATLLACGLILFNIWFPTSGRVELPTIASRLIAMLALVTATVLSDRNQAHQATVLQQQADLETQAKLTQVRVDVAFTLTHDLKAPLLGAIEILQAFQQGNFGAIRPRQKSVLEIIARSHQTTLKMVETLLEIYRNDNAGLALDLAPADLAQITAGVAATMTDLAATRQIQIVFNRGTFNFHQSLWVRGDTLQLQRVIANLLTNAIDHSPRGQQVEVILEADATEQLVKITYSGATLKPNELPHLFERFHYGQSDRQVKGAGLRLYLSRQIIEAHGGTIWAENRYPIGVSLAFRLPTCPVPVQR